MPPLLKAAAIAIGAVALLILFILSLRGTLTIAYDGEFSLYFRVLFFNIKLLPWKKRKKRYRKTMSARKAKRIRIKARRKAERRRLRRKKPVPEEQKKPEEPKKEPTSLPKIPIRPIARELIDIMATATEAVAIIVKRFTHHLRIKVARFKVTVATGDPAVTAVTYGAASQIINVLLPILSTVKNFKLPPKDEFGVSVDFTKETPDIDIKLSFSLCVWNFVDIWLRAAFGALSKYVDRKGGVDNTFKSLAELFGSFMPQDNNKPAKKPTTKKAPTKKENKK